MNWPESIRAGYVIVVNGSAGSARRDQTITCRACKASWSYPNKPATAGAVLTFLEHLATHDKAERV